MSDCVECKLQNCTSIPSIAIYSLQDRLFFNGIPLTVVVNCPPGRTCAPGTYPRVITYPPGTFYFPDPGDCNGFPIVIGMQGCISYVQRTLPCGATQAERQAAASEVIAELAEQQGICDSENNFPPSPTVTNDALAYEFECGEGQGPSYSGNLPYYLTIDLDDNTITIASGMFAGATKAIANTIAQTYLNNFVEQAISDGVLTCEDNCVIDNSSPLPAGEVGTPYSETLTASVIPGTLEWSVVSGSLPNGLSLDDETGEISGTPISEETANFTVEVSNGTISCQKGFSLEIASSASCPDWTTLLWAAPNVFTSGTATGSFTPDSTTGDAYQIDASCGGNPGDQSSVSNQAELTYNGTGCNCNLHFNLTNTGALGAGWVVIVSSLSGVLVNQLWSVVGVGTFDVPFSIPDTGGMDDTITVQVVAQKDQGTGTNGTMSSAGQITNV